MFQFGSQVFDPAACQSPIDSPIKLLLFLFLFPFFFRLLFHTSLLCFKALRLRRQVLRFSDYPQGSAGLHMKAYSSASHSTVIVSIGLESLVNTKQERGSFSSRHFTLSSSTPQSYSILRPALPYD